MLIGIHRRIWSCEFGRAKAHCLYSHEFEAWGPAVWYFVWTWDKDSLRCVEFASLDFFSSKSTGKLSVLGLRKPVIGDCFSVIAFSGGSLELVESYASYQ